MGATVRIDFAIGGAEAASRMFRTVQQSADLAAKAQIKSALQAQKAQERAAAEGGRAILKANQDVLRAHLKRTETQMKLDAKVAAESIKAHERAEREKSRATERRVTQEARQARQTADANRRVEERTVSERRQAFGQTLSAAGRGAVTGVQRVASIARAGVTTAAEGLGIDLGVGSSLKRRTERGLSAIDLVNSATQGNGEKTGAMRLAEAKALEAQAVSVGSKYGRDGGSLLTGGQKFVAATGDLEAFKSQMDDLARISNATGANFDDVAEAAGRLTTKLPKDQVLVTLRALAGQGKVGAVELKDMIKGAPMLGGLAGLFGGPRERSVGNLGALAQIAIEKGTVSSADEAFTSVRAFVNTFAKRARRKELKAMGIKTEDDKGNLYSPEDILVEAVSQTNGDKNKLLGRAFMDTRSHPIVLAAMNAFKEAGGGEKGAGAIRDMFVKYRKASLTKGEEVAANEARMGTDAAKGVQLQAKYDALIAKMADSVIPAFEKLAPQAQKAADALASLVDMAAKNPWTSVAVIIGGSIAKEIAAAQIGNAIKAMVSGGAGAGAGGGGAGGAAILGAGIGLAVGAAAASGIDADLNAKQRNANEWTSYGLNALGSGDRKAQEEALVNLMAEREQKGGFTSFLDNAWTGMSAGYKGLAAGEINATNIASAHPLVAAARGVVEGAVGTQQDNQANANNEGLIAALQAELAKPTKIDGPVTVNVANIGDFPKPGGSPRSDPIVSP